MASKCGGGCNYNKDDGSLNKVEDKTDKDCYRCHESPAKVVTRKPSCYQCYLETFRRNFVYNLRTKCIRREYTPQPLVLVSNGNAFSTALVHLLLDRNKRRYLKASHMPSDSDVAERLFASDDITIPCIVSLDYHVGVEGTEASRATRFFEHIKKVVNLTGNSNVTYDSLSCNDHVVDAHLMDRIRLSHLSVCYFLHKDNVKCGERCRMLKESLSIMHDENRYDQLLYALDMLRAYNLHAYLKQCGLDNPYVGMCDSQDVIATRVMFLTCIGGGHAVASRSAYLDDITLTGAGRIIRPLRSFSAKEITLYHRLSGLPQLVHLDHYWYSAPQTSILGCVNNLMETVSVTHNNTLHNICNVVEKLEGEFQGALSACLVCHQAVYTTDAEVSLCTPCGYMCAKSSSFDKFASVVTASFDAIDVEASSEAL